jgi:hypothetical protein
MASNLISKYALKGTQPYVVASGSLFTRTGPLLFGVFRGVVLEVDPAAHVKLNDRPPVAGAVRAALQACGAATNLANETWETVSSSYEGALHG